MCIRRQNKRSNKYNIGQSTRHKGCLIPQLTYDRSSDHTHPYLHKLDQRQIVKAKSTEPVLFEHLTRQVLARVEGRPEQEHREVEDHQFAEVRLRTD